MSVSVLLALGLTVTEVLETGIPFASPTTNNKEVVHNGLNTTATLGAATTPPAAKVAGFLLDLVAGAATIDLRALSATNGTILDGNGLKVQAVKFRNKSTNANDITLAVGAANGYELLGAGWTLTLKPGDEALFYKKDTGPDIDATHKIIDVTGTGAQVLECLLVLG